MVRGLVRCVGVLVLLAGAAFIWVKTSAVRVEDLPPLQDGDVLFQTTNTSQTLAILAASASLYSHTGIVHQRDGGEYSVIEAGPTVREVPLQGWINSGIAGRVTIKRMQGITKEQGADIVAAAGAYKGRLYDYLFRFDNDTTYCSELVYDAYQDALHEPIGTVERIEQLNTDNALVRKIIEARWQMHPLCQEGEARHYEACYDLIMKQELITPASVAADSRLHIIYSNYSPF